MTRKHLVRALTVLVTLVGGGLATPVACSGDNGNGSDASNDVTACSSPNLQCGSQCTDPQSDPNNCGACGTKCDTANAEVCSQGKCALECGGGTAKCGSSCFDLQSDQKNCGACGNACAQGQSCSAGKCSVACSAGLTQCGDAGACVDTSTDALNCGACGNVCGPNTTCQAGACAANLLTTAPIAISGTLTNCTTANASTGRKTALDDANNLYVAMICNSTVYVATSTNGGISFDAPVATPFTTANEVAILAGRGAKAPLYVAAVMQPNTTTLFTSSTDLGKTFAAPLTLDTGSWGSSFGVSMDEYKGTVYIETVPTGGQHFFHVLRNGTGAGDAGLVDASDAGWELTNLYVDGGNGLDPNDIAVDQSNGNVWAFGEDGTYSLMESTNGGGTWNGPFIPPGNNLYTEWAISKSTIFQVGTSDLLTIIPTSAPTTATTIAGLGGAGGPSRSLGLDTNGNAYVATPNGNNVRVDRVLFSATQTDGGVDGGAVISSTRNVAAAGSVTNTSITARAANAALVAWTVNGVVYASVQSY